MIIAASFITSLTRDQHYGSLSGNGATPCYCSTISYSVLQACAICQGAQAVPYAPHFAKTAMFCNEQC